MTNQEAIHIIESLKPTNIKTSFDAYIIGEALTMAIKALEQEPSVEFVKTEESNDNDTKYLNINVSDDEVKRNPDIVRLCSDVGILEYAKPKEGHWIHFATSDDCSECGWSTGKYISPSKYCPNCGVKMESEDKG